MKYVIDASVALRWFIENEKHPHADAVLAHLMSEPALFAVPELFAFEVFAVMQRVHPRKDAFISGMLPLLNGGLLRYPMTDELAAAAVGYCSAGLTGYDGTYAALAEILDAKWLTFDRRAHKAIQSADRSISLHEEVPDFSK